MFFRRARTRQTRADPTDPGRPDRPEQTRQTRADPTDRLRQRKPSERTVFEAGINEPMQTGLIRAALRGVWFFYRNHLTSAGHESSMMNI